MLKRSLSHPPAVERRDAHVTGLCLERHSRLTDVYRHGSLYSARHAPAAADLWRGAFDAAELGGGRNNGFLIILRHFRDKTMDLTAVLAKRSV